jgi:hypothetical protein
VAKAVTGTVTAVFSKDATSIHIHTTGNGVKIGSATLTVDDTTTYQEAKGSAPCATGQKCADQLRSARRRSVYHDGTSKNSDAVLGVRGSTIRRGRAYTS